MRAETPHAVPSTRSKLHVYTTEVTLKQLRIYVTAQDIQNTLRKGYSDSYEIDQLLHQLERVTTRPEPLGQSEHRTENSSLACCTSHLCCELLDEPQPREHAKLLDQSAIAARPTDQSELQVYEVEVDMGEIHQAPRTPEPSNATATFPTLRRPVRRPLATKSDEVIDEWFQTSQLTIRDACPSELLMNMKRLFYTYRTLHADSQLEIKPTDLYTHRVRLTPGTTPHNDTRKTRLSDRQRY